MKAILFVPVADSTAWIDETLPGVSPAELPVAGRSAIEYALEEAAKAGYDMAEVLDYRPSAQAGRLHRLRRVLVRGEMKIEKFEM